MAYPNIPVEAEPSIIVIVSIGVDNNDTIKPDTITAIILVLIPCLNIRIIIGTGQTKVAIVL